MPAAVLTENLQALAAEHRSVLKDEPRTLVELLGRGEQACVRKVYRNRGLRLLQTFGRRSRAAREFANLTAIHRAGIPCTEPIACAEARRAGFVLASELVTRFVADAVPVKQLLQDTPRERAGERRWIVERMGTLLAELHRAGILWAAARPRNFLLQGRPGRGRMLLCDAPGTVHSAHSIAGTRLALVDLFEAAASASRRREFSPRERLRLLRSYAGDRAGARTLWRALARRTAFGHRLRKNFVMALHTYILAGSRRAARACAP
jgi:tRNA A-37 threonylcarbamoyl transferase component Bud32